MEAHQLLRVSGRGYIALGNLRPGHEWRAQRVEVEARLAAWRGRRCDPASGAHHLVAVMLLDHTTASGAGIPGIEGPFLVVMEMAVECENEFVQAMLAAHMPAALVG